MFLDLADNKLFYHIEFLSDFVIFLMFLKNNKKIKLQNINNNNSCYIYIFKVAQVIVIAQNLSPM